MRIAAVILLAVALVIGGVALWGYQNAQLQVSFGQVEALESAVHPQEFEQLFALLSRNAARGVVFGQVDGPASDYVILQYTMRVRNRGLVAAEMLEAQISPREGDVLCYSQQEASGQDVNVPVSVAPGQEILFRCYLLTSKAVGAEGCALRPQHPVREVHVSYYVWGNPFFLRLTYG